MSDHLDAKAIERRLHLWFFRDLSDKQRLTLFRLCDYPVGPDIPLIQQTLVLRHLVAALTAGDPSANMPE